MRDEANLTAADTDARADGAWRVRYSTDADLPRLRRLFEQYRGYPEWSVYRLPDKAWTRAMAKAWVRRVSHPLVVEKDGAIVASLVVREASASRPRMMVAECCPTDLTLSRRDRMKAQLSLTLAFLRFLERKGFPAVRVRLTPSARANALFSQVVAPERIGRLPDGSARTLEYTDAVAHALPIVRSLLGTL